MRRLSRQVHFIKNGCPVCPVVRRKGNPSVQVKGTESLELVTCKLCMKQHYSEAERLARKKSYQHSYRLQWYKDNPDYNREHYTNNRETIMLAVKKWQAGNLSKVRSYKKNSEHMRRVLLASGTTKGIDSQSWSDRLEEYAYRCAYCVQYASTVDHIVPVSRGGSNEISNLVPCCSRCNSSKGNKPLLSWLLTSKIAQQALIGVQE